MSKFTGEISGSLIFRQNSVAQTELRPGTNALNLTGSLNISGSQLTLNGVNIYQRILEIDAGGGGNSEIGRILLWSGSVEDRLYALNNYTSSVVNLNNATSSYFLKADAGNIISSSTQILSLGFAKDNVISGSQQILNLGFAKDNVISSSLQIRNLGFVTSSNIAAYTDLYDVPSGIISSSQQVVDLGFVTGSSFNDLTNLPSGLVSGSSQTVANLVNQEVNLGTNSITASYFKGDGSQLENITVSQAVTIREDFTNETTLSVNHAFNSWNIAVTVYDSDRKQLLPKEVTLIDTNNVSIEFNQTSSGHAVIALGGHIVENSQDYNTLINVPSDIISSSAQITALGFSTGGGGGTGSVSPGTISSSAQISDLGFITGSTFESVLDKPSGLISSSAQLIGLGFVTSSEASDFSGLNTFTGSIQGEVNALKAQTGSYLTSLPNNVFSSSAQISSLGFITSSHADVVGLNTFTGSIQGEVDAIKIFTGSIQNSVNNLTLATGSYLTSLPNNLISGSSQISALGFVTSSGDSTPAGTISSSAQISALGFITSSAAADISGLATTGSNTFIGNQVVSGSIIPGAITNDLGTQSAPWQHLYISSGSIKFVGPDGTVLSSFNNTFDGNRVISNTDHPLFNSFNPGSTGTIEDFLTAVFYPNTAPTITTGNQVIAEYTTSGSSVVTLAGTDAESQAITFSLDDSYTDGYVVVESGVLKLNVLPTAANFNTDDRGDGTLAHPVVIKATDTVGASSTKTIYIRVTPNEAPVFRHPNIGSNAISSYSVSRNENASAGEITKIYFTDTEGDSITINSGSDPNGHFSITRSSNYVSITQVTASLDYESITSYSLSITASDAHYEAGEDADSFIAIPITINVTDNTQPSVNNQTLTGLNENSSDGASAGSISATDPEGDTITFKNARFYGQELDGSEVATGSYGGTSQSDPTEDAFTISSTGVVTRKAGVYLNSDLVNKVIYQVTVTDAYNNGSDTGLISIPIADDTAPTISGDTTLYVIESAIAGNNIYDNSNGYSGTTSRFTANQSVTWAVSSSNDFNINSNGYLTLARNISGSSDVGGDQLSGVVTATNSFGTATTQAFTVNITDNTAPNITFTNTSANLNTNKARPGNNLVTLTFSDPEGNSIDYNSFSTTLVGDLQVVESGNSRIIRANSNLSAGTYSVTASIADEYGFATRTSSHAFTIAQSTTGTLAQSNAYIIESATSGDQIKRTSNGRTGNQSYVSVSYSPNYGSQAVQAYTSSNSAIAISSNGYLSLATDLSGSLTGSGDSIVSTISYQDQYGNIGSGNITVNVAANAVPTVSISTQSGLETDTISGSLAATITASDTESDYPLTLTLGGSNASSFTATSTNVNGTAWNVHANTALSAGSYTLAVTASDAFGKEGYDTATVTVNQSADYGLVYVYTSTYGSDAGFASNYLGVMGGATVNSDVPPEVTSYTANTSSPYYKFKSGDIGSSTISLAGGGTATLRASGSGAGLDQVLSSIGSISAATTGQVIVVYPSGSDMSVPTSVQESFNSTAGGAVPAMNVDGNGYGIESGVIHSLTLDSAHLGYSEWFVFGRKSQNAIASSFDIRLINASGSLPS